MKRTVEIVTLTNIFSNYLSNTSVISVSTFWNASISSRLNRTPVQKFQYGSNLAKSLMARNVEPDLDLVSRPGLSSDQNQVQTQFDVSLRD